MQVERATATTTMEHHGQKLYFCSGCRDEFARDPDHFMKPGVRPEAPAPASPQGHE
jgi:YHS domain-containing protein